ncbi:hypothetical protein AHAS_Ahas09G0080900 [Arachis hypogaea]
MNLPPPTNTTNTSQAPSSSSLPSQPLPNPRDNINAITLRSAKKAKKHEEFDPNMVQIFKNVEVIIPLFDAIHQVPKHAKFLKDVCTHKEKIRGLGMNLLGNSVSSVMDDFLEKYSDLNPCLVSCMIGEIQLKDCMCALESCVSIMPLSIHEK